MRKFELILILNPGIDKAGQEKILAKIKKIITDAGGKVENVEDWGKRDLAYAIAKQEQGIYYLLTFAIEGKEAKGIGQKIEIEKEVLRHLLVRKE